MAAVALTVGCTPDDEIRAHAGFSTDKEEYHTGDLVTITNTAMADGALIAVCKWEYMGQTLYDLEAPEPFYVDEGGEFVIRQTITTHRGSVQMSCEKTIRVIDDNTPPVPDFSWRIGNAVEPAFHAGEEVEFIDRSSDPDPDGSIVEWEWNFGGTIVRMTDPAEAAAVKFTFSSHGKVNVVLTVTDNRRAKASATRTIEVGKSPTSMGIWWTYPYDTSGTVKGSSPACKSRRKVCLCALLGLPSRRRDGRSRGRCEGVRSQSQPRRRVGRLFRPHAVGRRGRHGLCRRPYGDRRSGSCRTLHRPRRSRTAHRRCRCHIEIRALLLRFARHSELQRREICDRCSQKRQQFQRKHEQRQRARAAVRPDDRLGCRGSACQFGFVRLFP